MNEVFRGLGLAVLFGLAGLAGTVQGQQLTDASVKKLQDQCEAKREEKLAPIRAQKTQACIEQQLRSNCETYYRTYGNVSRLPTGAAGGAYFYDLPECQAWIEAREKLRASRSRP